MTAFDDLSLLRAFVCILECGSVGQKGDRSDKRKSERRRDWNGHRGCKAPNAEADESFYYGGEQTGVPKSPKFELDLEGPSFLEAA
jgi:hypothetical protein